MTFFYIIQCCLHLKYICRQYCMLLQYCVFNIGNCVLQYYTLIIFKHCSIVITAKVQKEGYNDYIAHSYLFILCCIVSSVSQYYNILYHMVQPTNTAFSSKPAQSLVWTVFLHAKLLENPAERNLKEGLNMSQST